MKKLMLAVLLSFGLATPALAVPPCWPGKPVNVAVNQYLSPAQLLAWWQSNTIPVGVANPHYYVAFHASDRYCKSRFGNSSWSVITGPYPLVGTVNGTIDGGVIFNCQKCSSIYAEPAPVDPDPSY